MNSIVEKIYEDSTLSRYIDIIKKIKKIDSKTLNVKDIKKYSIDEKIAIICSVINEKFSIELYNEQILAILIMYNDYIVEMKTGEGKSYVGLVINILKALESKVYFVTVNNYLAKRDAVKFEEIYNIFGLTVSYNETHSENDEVDKKSIHECDVIYTASDELIFDYLRTRDKTEKLVKFDNVILDEVDFVFIDNATSVCSVAEGESRGLEKSYIAKMDIAYEIIDSMQGYEINKKENEDEVYFYYDCDYVYSMYNKSIQITENGYSKFYKIFGRNLFSKNDTLYSLIIYALEAKHFYIKDRDYFVKNNNVCLINRYNGRGMENSKFSSRLQNAIERKEKVELSQIEKKENSIAYQLFFSKFDTFTGMSGTAYSSRDEFREILDVDTIAIPEHKKNKRIDHGIIVTKTKNEKYKKAIDFVVEKNGDYTPILVVTSSEPETFTFEKLLKFKGLEAKTLTNHNTDIEEEIIKNAGIISNITISTNLVGRGTDINIDDDMEKLGGLCVVSINKFTSDRVDLQVVGRAARQGQNGSNVFIISLEDELFKFMDSKELNYYLNLKDELFESDKIQRQIKKDIKVLQDRVTKLEKDERKYNFIFDEMLDEVRKDIFKEKIEIENIKTEVALRNDVMIKIDEISKEAPYETIINKIYSILLKQYYHEFAFDINYLKRDVHTMESRKEFVAGRFKKELYSKFDMYKNRVKEITFKNFLTVKIKEKIDD